MLGPSLYPGVAYYWGNAAVTAEAASRSYLARHAVRGGWAYLKNAVLLKVIALSMVQYEVILFVDIDADVFPEPWAMSGKETDGGPRRSARASNWERSIGAFMASDALYAATPDHSSPANAGVWLAKPREWLFRAAVRCLHNCSWDAERGFNSISRPRRIANNAPLLRRLAAGVGDGSVNDVLDNHAPSDFSTKDAFKLVMRQMQGTDFYKKNTWFFVAGNLESGLLFYLMYLRFGVGTWSSPFTRDPESVYINHYWGPGKPWDRPGGNAQQVYLTRAIAAGALRSVGGGALTKCQQHLGTLWEKLVQKGLENKSDARFSPYRHAVLPDYRSMRTFTRPGGGSRSTPATRRRRDQSLVADKGVHCDGDPPAWLRDPARATAGLKALSRCVRTRSAG